MYCPYLYTYIHTYVHTYILKLPLSDSSESSRKKTTIYLSHRDLKCGHTEDNGIVKVHVKRIKCPSPHSTNKWNSKKGSIGMKM